jgi:hypothetical protein
MSEMKIDEEWRNGIDRKIKLCADHAKEVKQGCHLNILFGGYFEQNRCHVYGCTSEAVITYRLEEIE